MGRRHAARQLAVQALYALAMNAETTPPEAVEAVWREHGGAAADRDYLEELVAGTWERRTELDAALRGASRNWRLSRMDRVDLSVLRLAVHELLFRGDTPAPVILDEGVELAKEFGTPESPAFVNGILDRLAREHRGGELGEGKGRGG